MHLRSAVALVAAQLLIAALPSAASAATFTVTKTIDGFDGACNADCSLREAVQAANADATQDTIVLPAGRFTLNIPGTVPEDANASGDLDVTKDTIIRGAGPSLTRLDQTLPSTYEDRIFEITGVGTDVELHDLTVAGGFSDEAGSFGGNISTHGAKSLLLDHVVLTGGRAEGKAAYGDGGNLYFAGGTLTVHHSAILDGRAASAGYGGGVALATPGTVASFENTTISGNRASATGHGSAVFSLDAIAATFTHTTIVGNQMEGTTGYAVDGEGGGDVSLFRFRSSIVAGNTRADNTSANCSPANAPASDGGNVGEALCGFTQVSDARVSDPLLGTRSADPIPVLVPLAGSPAIDRAVGACPATDARDLPRPSGSACDAGAAELQVPPAAVPAPGAPTPAPTPTDTTAPTLALPTTVAVDAKRRKATLSLTCPATESRCSGSVRLLLTRRVRGKSVDTSLGKASFAIAGGATAKITITLSRAGRAAIAGRTSRKITLAVDVADAAGNTATPRAPTRLLVAKAAK